MLGEIPSVRPLVRAYDLPNGLFLLKIQKQGAFFTEKIVIEK
jgi:hypothetical protein